MIGKIKDFRMSRGLRYNDGKPVLSMLLEARNAMTGMARVMEYGRKKYDRGNWFKGLPHTEVVDCLLRHTMAYLAGEDTDPESGLPHVDFIAVNGMFLSELTKLHPEMDDRYKVDKTNKELSVSKPIPSYTQDGATQPGCFWGIISPEDLPPTRDQLETVYVHGGTIESESTTTSGKPAFPCNQKWGMSLPELMREQRREYDKVFERALHNLTAEQHSTVQRMAREAAGLHHQDTLE